MINPEDHNINTHEAFTRLIPCPLCEQEKRLLPGIAEIKTIATRRHALYQEIVLLSLLISCPNHGMLKRIGAFSDYEFTNMQGGITETSPIELLDGDD